MPEATESLPVPPPTVKGVETATLSVIVVSFNTREMTLACLRSLYAETRDTDFETIVVDNDSKDGSADAIAAEFPQVRLVRSRENLKFALANNRAIEHARGEFVLLLNPDTVVLDRAVDRLMEFARRRPDAGIWGGRTVFADGRLNPSSCFARLTLWSTFCRFLGLIAVFPGSRVFNPEMYGSWPRDREARVDIVSGCFLLIRRDFWNELAGFDRKYFMYGEEADLCARARARGARPAITPEATIVHHAGASQSSVPDRLIKLFRGRLTLGRDHLGPARGRLAVALMRWMPFFQGWFYLAVGTALRLPNKRDRGRTFLEVWRRRGEWHAGY